MKIELVFFRFVIFISVAALFSFGAGWAYSMKKAIEWQSLASSTYESMNKSGAVCEQDKQATECEFYDSWKDMFERSVAHRDQFRERKELLGILACAIPLAALAVFYLLRWVLTGRMRPVIVRGTSEQVPK